MKRFRAVETAEIAGESQPSRMTSQLPEVAVALHHDGAAKGNFANHGAGVGTSQDGGYELRFPCSGLPTDPITL